MLIPAARGAATGQQKSQTASLPAPTGGWNARDPLALMAPQDAIRLDNYFPATQSVDLRTGSARYATITGVTTPVESLISYSSGATSKLLACANNAIYDASAGGTISSSLATGFTSNRWQDVYMGGYQLLFNGSDTPQKFDGTSITANTITGTGLTPSNLIYPNVFGQRVFAVEKNTLNVWYLGLQAISGAASKLDFSYYCKLGGSMVAMGSWSQDGGNGPFDYAVFVTSMGEVLIYQGTDPSNASTWALQGVFRIGSPIGQRPLMKAGSDLIVICEDGFVPLSRVLSLDRIGAEAVALSDKIRDATSEATSMYKSNFGWQAILYPQSNWAVFNVPLVENTQTQQYVLNTLTNSWCRFTGWGASCFGLFKEKLYFGGFNGIICLADTGNSDDNASRTAPAQVAIQGNIKTSFQYLGQRSAIKHYKMVRPVLLVDGTLNVSVSVSVDYGDVQPTVITTPTASGALWNVATWDVTPWSSGPLVRKNWTSVSANGYNAALSISTLSSGLTISLASIDWLFEQGGVM